jgi:hypothetical protein
MKLRLPLYEGDGIIRPAPEVGAPAEKSSGATENSADFVRRTTTVQQDVNRLEATARKTRGSVVAAFMKTLLDALAARLEGVRYRRIENYLKSAQSLAEIESRLRHFDHPGKLRHI